MNLPSSTMNQQYILKKGIKEFGDKRDKAVTKELTQLHDMSDFTPVDYTKMAKKERYGALVYLMLSTKKSNGDIKAQGCADGSKQREAPTYQKECVASPTISIEGIMIICDIESHE